MDPISKDLEQAAKGFMQATLDHAPDRIAEFFAENAVAMYPIPLPIYGQKENWKAWTAALEPVNVSHPVIVDEVCTSISNDMGYVYGRWWYINPTENVHEGGRYIAIWRPIRGEWRIQFLSAVINEDISAVEPETN